MSSALSIQLLSQNAGGAIDDLIMLDIHSIADLQSKNVPTTDDSHKYKYISDSSGTYGRYFSAGCADYYPRNRCPKRWSLRYDQRDASISSWKSFSQPWNVLAPVTNSHFMFTI